MFIAICIYNYGLCININIVYTIIRTRLLILHIINPAITITNTTAKIIIIRACSRYKYFIHILHLNNITM